VAFTIGAFAFFLAVLYTVVTTKEYPPEDPAAFEKARRETSGLGHAFREIFQGIGSILTMLGLKSPRPDPAAVEQFP
jgi:maltose/moltooligosaccharide transporter